MSATAETTGHVFLAVALVSDDFETSFQAVLEFESGQLDKMAVALDEWFQ
jgi:hypothetical protein